MVVQRARNNTPKANTICRGSQSSYNRKETKLKDVCSGKQQNTCVRTAEYKSDQHRYSCNEKEVILYFHFEIKEKKRGCILIFLIKHIVN